MFVNSHARVVARSLHCTPSMKATNLISRITFSLIFIFAALGHFDAATIAYAKSAGVPLADLAVPASGILALASGLSIALGFKARLGGIGVVLFLIPTTLMMHNFWAVTDPMMHQMQLANFMKNVALVGGALAFVVHGAGALSLDARLAAGRRTLEPVAA
jgi:putative oxidoreductase